MTDAKRDPVLDCPGATDLFHVFSIWGELTRLRIGCSRYVQTERFASNAIGSIWARHQDSSTNRENFNLRIVFVGFSRNSEKNLCLLSRLWFLLRGLY